MRGGGAEADEKLLLVFLNRRNSISGSSRRSPKHLVQNNRQTDHAHKMSKGRPSPEQLSDIASLYGSLIKIV